MKSCPSSFPLLVVLSLVALLFDSRNVVSAFLVGTPMNYPPSSISTTTTSLQMTVLAYNGKKKDFKPGTPLSKAVAQLGIKPTYSCKKYVSWLLGWGNCPLSYLGSSLLFWIESYEEMKCLIHGFGRWLWTRYANHSRFVFSASFSNFRGDCATCEIFLAGRMTKPCVAKVPAEPKLKSLQEKGLELRV